MDKTAKTEYGRRFLIEDLPEPLTRASSHLQLFDNYIENTRIRLRSIRVPETKAWTRVLQQRIDLEAFGEAKLSEMYLNDDEYLEFERFEGREIRLNRYFHEFDRRVWVFDVYLGKLWGLCTAKAEFDDSESLAALQPPGFAAFEITDNQFFDGAILVEKIFSDIQAEAATGILGPPIAPSSSS
ncbi:MAG: hypothetical protein WBD22_14730 [Pyrinomonadaceae bacterium]